MSGQRLCGHPRKGDGEPCEAFVVCADHGRCYTHDPCREEERQHSRRKGGVVAAQKARDNQDDPAVLIGEAPPPPESLEDAAAWAAWATHMVATGKLGNTRARTIGKLLEVFRKATERGEARKELQELKDEIEKAVREGAPHLEALP